MLRKIRQKLLNPVLWKLDAQEQILKTQVQLLDNITGLQEKNHEVVKSLDPKQKEEIDIYNFQDFKLLLEQKGFVDNCMITSGCYDSIHIEYFKKFWNYGGRKKKIFLDIGSYFGLYSLHAYKSNLFNEIYAFEADRYNYSQMQANLFINRIVNINAVNKAVSDKDGVICQHPSMTVWGGVNRGGSFVGNPENVEDEFDSISVDCVALDSFFSPEIKDSVLICKIDVERHEVYALNGMKNLIRNNKVIMQVEVFNMEQADNMESFMKENGLVKFHQIGDDFYITNVDDISNLKD